MSSLKKNLTCYATNVKQFNLSFINFNKLYFAFQFIRTFICEYTTWTNIFGYSFIKNVDNRIYSDIHS